TLSISNVNGPYEIDGSDLIDDVLTLSKVAGHFQYVLNGAAPIIIDGATAFTFNGEGGNDTMIVDEIGGNPVPAGGAAFIGGSNGAVGDNLIIANGSFSTVTANDSNATDGALNLDGVVITFATAEGIADTSPTADL